MYWRGVFEPLTQTIRLVIPSALPLSSRSRRLTTDTSAVFGLPIATRVTSAFERISLCSPCSRSEEHTSELQSLMRISYAVFCLKKKNNKNKNDPRLHPTTKPHDTM